MYVATLPCEMFLLRNRYTLEVSEAYCHAGFSHSILLLKNRCDGSIIWFTDEKTFARFVVSEAYYCNLMLLQQFLPSCV